MSTTTTSDSTTNQNVSPQADPDSPPNCLRHCSEKVTMLIPQSFSESFLWDTTEASVAPENDALAGPTFSDEVITEALASASYAFACSEGMVQLENNSLKEHPERNMTLYCPDKGGNVVVDSMVKLIAARQKADVLVLDALELAAAEFGALGENASVIDLLYKEAAKVKEKPKDKLPGKEQACAEEVQPEEAKKKQESEQDRKGFDTQRVQAFFNALMDIAPKCSAKCDRESEPTTTKPLRRIIYLRDFGTIARAAKPLMTFILHAMDNSRNRCCSDGVTWAPLLIMGITKRIVMPDGDNDSEDDDDGFRFRRISFVEEREKDPTDIQQHTAMRTSGYRLTKLIPRLDNKYPTSKNEASTALFNGLSAQLFLPLVVKSSKLNYSSLEFDSFWPSRLDNLATYSVFLCIVMKNAHTETAQRDRELDLRQRMQAINETLVRICLRKRGGLIEREPSPKILIERSENEDFQTSVLLPSVADTIATTAIGLAYSNSQPMLVTPAQVAEGYQIFLDAQRCRDSWIDEDQKSKGQANPADPIIKKVKESSELSRSERALLNCIIDTTSLMTTFNDVCVDPQVVEMLRTVVSLPIMYPDHFNTGILATEAIMGVLLYGPPGTGKTMLCRALAHECGARMIVVKPTDILDRVYGESEKKASAVFSLAHRLAPCVVFIDEVDALFGARDSSSSGAQYHKSNLTEFMQAMDGLQSVGNKKKGVVVIGATNRPFDIDEAVLRRLPCRVLVDLPDIDQRKKILQVHLKHEACDADLAEIAEGTDGYSGSDLKNVCVSAAMAAVKDAVGTLNWDKNGKATADPHATTGDVASNTYRKITMTHFGHALSEVSASLSEDASEELYQWHETFSTTNKYLAPERGINNSNGKINEKAQFETKGDAVHSEMLSFFDIMAEMRK